AFRMSGAGRATRQRRILEFVTVTVVITLAIVTLLRSNIVNLHNDLDLSPSQLAYDQHKARVTRIFMNLKGDPKLVHRLSSFLYLELEDAGIVVAKTEGE